MPWDVGRLTPFQVKRIFMVERTKDGAVVLDPPPEPAGGERELTLEGEFRAEWIRRGVTDPDALAMLVRQAVEADVLAEGTEVAGEGDD